MYKKFNKNMFKKMVKVPGYENLGVVNISNSKSIRYKFDGYNLNLSSPIMYL
jgi:hypothetical protein